MGITNFQIIKAAADDTDRLEADVATAIAAGWEPSGPLVTTAHQVMQPMVKGAAIGSITAIEGLQARQEVTDYTADGAVSVTPGIKTISKTSAAAMTLAAPDNDGDEIDIIAATAFAHVITATGLIDDGVTGGAKDAITLGAFVGACITLVGISGHWVVKSQTVAAVA